MNFDGLDYGALRRISNIIYTLVMLGFEIK